MAAHAWTITKAHGPLIATAIHAGHELRADVLTQVDLAEEDRLREEDPFTDMLLDVAPTRVTVLRSRFEVDLNRPRETAVYRTPEDAWGLHVWRDTPSDAVVEESLAIHDRFYAEMTSLIDSVIEREGFALVLDVHSYNHRRDGHDEAAADPADNPDVNVGTGSLDRDRWAPVVDAFVAQLSSRGPDTGTGPTCDPLDVRENIKFLGGAFPTWVNRTFPTTACALAVEFKKTFMDEWTGQVDRARLDALRNALASAASAAEQAARSVVSS